VVENCAASLVLGHSVHTVYVFPAVVCQLTTANLKIAVNQRTLQLLTPAHRHSANECWLLSSLLHCSWIRLIDQSRLCHCSAQTHTEWTNATTD